MKKITFLAIAALCILFFNGCSNSSTVNVTSNEINAIEITDTNDVYHTFGTTYFQNKVTKNIFYLIADGNCKNQSGYNKIIQFLENTDHQNKSIGSVWRLGSKCYLILDNSRHLYLSTSNKTLSKCYIVFNNVDNFYFNENQTEDFIVLNAPSTDFPNSCVIGDISYSNGQFCYMGELLFDKIHIGGIVTLSNYQITPDGTKQILATCGERTVLITEKDHIFSTKPI